MKKIKSFKYKIGINIVLFIVLFTVGIGVLEYYYSVKILTKNYEEAINYTENDIKNQIEYIDAYYYTLEKFVEKDMEIILEDIIEDYNNKNYINISKIKEKVGEFDYYIIDSSNSIKYTNNENDLGLDFKKWPKFARMLDDIREKNSIVTDRIDLSINTNEFFKYMYRATEDKEYIFELGVNIEKYIGSYQYIGFDKIEKKIISSRKDVESVILYNSLGVAYNKYDIDNDKYIINERYKKFLNEAIKKNKTVSMEETENGYKKTRIYIPYYIKDAQSKNYGNVVEVVFNNKIINNSLLKIKYITVLVIILAFIICIFATIIFTNKLSQPLNALIHAFRSIEEGDLNYKLDIKKDDEFGILAKSFSNMMLKVNNLIAEREKKELELIEKNKEILENKDEINALYEETSAMNEELNSLLEENEKNYLSTVKVLVKSIEAKDEYTSGHCERVTQYSLDIAEALNLTQQDLLNIKFGGLLHDVGKIGIPIEILNKKGSLTYEEYEIMKTHTLKGYMILKDVEFLEKSINIVLQHHERIDGLGYPNAIKGEEIDLLAKIVSVADAYDAMTSKRPYRDNPMPKDMAIKQLIDNKDTQFDSSIVDVFIKILNEKYKDDEK